jgi:hypothetical protein
MTILIKLLITIFTNGDALNENHLQVGDFVVCLRPVRYKRKVKFTLEQAVKESKV